MLEVQSISELDGGYLEGNPSYGLTVSDSVPLVDSSVDLPGYGTITSPSTYTFPLYGENSGCSGVSSCGLWVIPFSSLSGDGGSSPGDAQVSAQLQDNYYGENDVNICGSSSVCTINYQGSAAGAYVFANGEDLGACTYTSQCSFDTSGSGGDGQRAAAVEWTVYVETAYIGQNVARSQVYGADYSFIENGLVAHSIAVLCPNDLVFPPISEVLTLIFLVYAFLPVDVPTGLAGLVAGEGASGLFEDVADFLIDQEEDFFDTTDYFKLSDDDSLDAQGWAEDVFNLFGSFPAITAGSSLGDYACGNVMDLWNPVLDEYPEFESLPYDLQSVTEAETTELADLEAGNLPNALVDYQNEYSALSQVQTDLEGSEGSGGVLYVLQQIENGNPDYGTGGVCIDDYDCESAAGWLYEDVAAPLESAVSTDLPIIESTYQMLSDLGSSVSVQGCDIPAQAETNVPFESSAMSVTGAFAPLSMYLSANTPSWISINGYGELQGTPPPGLNYQNVPVTVVASDAVGDVSSSCSGYIEVVPHIGLSTPPALDAANHDGADVGSPYSASVGITGGIGPYNAQVTSGDFPSSWLSLDSGSGTLSGTAPAGSEGTYTFSVLVTDSVGASSPQTFTLTVYPPLQVTLSLPPWMTRTTPASMDVGQSDPITAVPSGGGGGYSYAWSGTLSSCFNLGVYEQCYVGTPGTYSTEVTVTDANGAQASYQVPVVVNPDPVISIALSEPYAYYPALPNEPSSSTFTATVVGGAGGETYSWNNLPPGCTSLNASSISCTPTAPDPGARESLTIWDADGYQVTQAFDFPVYADPTLTQPTSSVPSVDVGQAVTFSTTTTGGAGGNTYDWTGLPLGSCTDTNALTVTCEPSLPGTYTINAQVTDMYGAQGSTDANPLTFVVYPDLSVLDPTASPGLVDVGQTVTFSTTISGGSGGFSFTWSGLPNGCASVNAATVSCAPTAPGEGIVSVSVTDSNGWSESAAMPSAFVVNPTLVAAPALSPSSVDVGQTLTISADAAGGSGVYSFYYWSASSSDLGCTLADAASITCVPTQPGSSYSVSVIVEDSNGEYSAAGTVGPFTVYSDPSVSVPAPSVPSLDLGQGVTFSALGSGGTGSYSYIWTAPSNMGCYASTSSSMVCYPSVVGAAYSVSVVAVDSNGAASPAVAFTPFVVYSDPVITSLASSLPSFDTNQSVTFTAAASGGTGSYVYYWEEWQSLYQGEGGQFYEGCQLVDVVPGATLGCDFPRYGYLTIIATVTDTNGAQYSAEFQTYVDPDPTATLTGDLGALLGEPFTVSASTIGGSGSITSYSWSSSSVDLGCQPANSPTLTCWPSAPGTYYSVYLNLTDSNGYTTPVPAVHSGIDVALLSITPSSGPEGSSVSLSGSGLQPDASYVYCLTAQAEVCPTDSPTLVTSSLGQVPEGVAANVTVSGFQEWFNLYLTSSCGSSSIGEGIGVGGALVRPDLGGGSAGPCWLYSLPFTETSASLRLSPSAGPLGTTVSLEGSGLAAFTSYFVCDQTLATYCPTGSTFTTDGTGTVPSGVAVSIVESGTSYVDVSQSAFGNLVAFEPFIATTASLQVSPGQGPVGTLLDLTGSGFAPSLTYVACQQETQVACVPGQAPISFTTTSAGDIPSDTWLDSLFLGASYVVVSPVAGGYVTASASFFGTSPALSLSPASGPEGTTINLTGSGYAPGEDYDVCFETSSSPCASYAGFLASPGGQIPSGVALVLTVGVSGTVAILDDSTGVLVAAAAFSTTNPSVSLSLTSGPYDTLITVSGSGLAPQTTYFACDYAGGAYCTSIVGQGPAATTFATDAYGNIPAGVVVSAWDYGMTAIAITQVQGGEAIAVLPFAVTTVTLALGPSTGPSNSLVTLSGSGYAPDTAYSYCFSAVEEFSGCSDMYEFSSTAQGEIPTVNPPTVTATTSGYVLVTQGADAANWIIADTFYATATPTLSLSPVSGPVDTLVSISGSGFAASTLYLACVQASATSCPGGSLSFTTDGSGNIPGGVMLTIPSTVDVVIDISQGPSAANFIVDAPFLITSISPLILSPSSGPAGTVVGLSASGLAPNTNYVACFQAVLGTCVSGAPTTMFSTDSLGNIPVGTEVDTPSLPFGYVAIYPASGGALVVYATFAPTTATLVATPSSGPVGSLVSLAGTGFAPDTAYLACFESTPAPCAPGSVTFTTDASGSLPAGLALTLTSSSVTELVISSAFAGGPAVIDLTFAPTSALFVLSSTTGPPGTLVILSGSGFAPTTLYNYCLSADSGTAGCSNAFQFTTDASGALPTGTHAPELTVDSAGYVTVTQGDLPGNLVAQAYFGLMTVPGLVLTPNQGPVFTVTTLTGSGLAPGGTYYYCLESSVESCPAFAQTFVATSGGMIPAGVTLDVAFASTEVADLSQSPSAANFIVSAMFTASVNAPTLTLTPSSGPLGTAVVLQGTGYAPNTVYVACEYTPFSTCDQSSEVSFITDSLGNIPQDTVIQITQTTSGSTDSIQVYQAGMTTELAVAYFAVTSVSLGATFTSGPVGSVDGVSASGLAPDTEYVVEQCYDIYHYGCRAPEEVESNAQGQLPASFSVAIQNSDLTIVPANDLTDFLADVPFSLVTPYVYEDFSQGPAGTPITIGGGGLAPSTTYYACFQELAQYCPGGLTFVSGFYGDIPSGVVLTVPEEGASFIDLSQVPASALITDVAFSLTQASLTLTPSTGPANTLVTLSGSGYGAQSMVYYYCFVLTEGPTGCPSTLSFTTTYSGGIPSSTQAPTLTTMSSGYVAVAWGTSASSFVVETPFVLTTPQLSLSSSFGPVGTELFVTGGGLTPYATYWICLQASSTFCSSGSTFTTDAFGNLPPQLEVTVTSMTDLYVDISQTTSGNLVANLPFSPTTASVSITPDAGPGGTPIVVTGSGYAPDTSYLACVANVYYAPYYYCDGPQETFVTDAFGNIPAGVTVWAYSQQISTTCHGDNCPTGVSLSVVAVNYEDGTLTASAYYSDDYPSLSLTPNDGPVNSLVTLSGKGYLPGAVYDYCFVLSDSPVGCSTAYQFTALPNGSIPLNANAPSLTVDQAGYMAISAGTSVNTFISNAEFGPSTSATLLLSIPEGPLGSLVVLNGTGYAPGQEYTFCEQALVAPCSSGPTFVASGDGVLAVDASLLVDLSGVSYVDVSQTYTGNLIASALFTTTDPTIALSPTSGPAGDLVGVSGGGLAPDTTYLACFQAEAAPCPAGTPFETDSFGNIPTTVELTVPLSGAAYVDISQTPTSGLVVSLSYTQTYASLYLIPGAGPLGTDVVLSGNGFSPGVAYEYCFQSIAVSCPEGSPTFVADANGQIAGGTALIFDAIGATVLDISDGSLPPNLIIFAVFTPTLPLTTTLPVATPGEVAPGETVTFWSNASGGVGPYTYAWSGLPTGCASSDTNALVCVPTTFGTYTITVTVTDSTGATFTSAPLIFTVGYPLSVSTPAASTPSGGIDVGQSVMFSVMASGGTGGYSYLWLGLPLGCSSTDAASVDCTPSTAGTYSITVQVTDSSGAMVTSSALVYTVDPALQVGTPSASPPSGDADAGQTVTFYASVSGGSGSYSFTWSGLPSGCSSENTAALSCTSGILPANTTFDVSVMIADSNGESGTSPALVYVIDSDPAARPVQWTTSSIDLGQSVTFSIGPGGGSGVYSFLWINLPDDCTSENTPVLICTPDETGLFPLWGVAVEITDTNGFTFTTFQRSAGTAYLTVYADPTVSTPVAMPSSVDAGQMVTFSTVVSGGSGGYGYVWSGLPAGCASVDAASFSCVPTTAGTYSVSVSVTDSNGYTVSSGTLSFTVGSALAVGAPTASPWSVEVGATTTFSVEASGGLGPYSYSWTGLPTGCASQDAPTLMCTPSASGTFTVSVTVTDSTGAMASSASLSFTVVPALAAPTPTTSTTLLDSSEYVTFQAYVSGGSGTYSYVWNNLPGCASENVSTLLCFAEANNQTFSVSYTVTDTLGDVVTSGSVQVTVDTFPYVTVVLPTPASVDVGQMVTLSVTPSGGTGVYTFEWYVPSSWTCAPGTVTNEAVITCVPSVAGTFYLETIIFDSSGAGYGPGSAEITVYSDPTVSTPVASPWSVDAGEVDTFATVVSGGAGGFSYAWSGLPPGCTSMDAASFSCTPTTAGVFTITVTATDANGYSVTSGSLTFTVDSALMALPPVSSRSPAEEGVYNTFYADAAGTGTGTYTYAWYGLPPGCASANASSISCYPGGPGVNATYNIYYTVTDTNGVTVTSPTLTLTVFSFPSVSQILFSPGSVDAGQTVDLRVIPSGGTGSYTFWWYFPASWSCTPGMYTSDAVLTCVPSAAGTFYLETLVFDSYGSGYGPGSSQYTVLSDPSVSTPVASPWSVDAGQAVTFSTIASGGSGGYSYTWSGLPAGCASVDAASFSCVPTTAGTYSISVSITDSNGYTTSSGVLSFTVAPALTIATPSPSRSPVDEGTYLGLSTSVSGGSGVYTLVWNGLPTNCVSVNATSLSCFPGGLAVNTTFDITVVATDTYGNTVTSAVLVLTVDTFPSVSRVMPSPGSIDAGQSVTLTVVPSGGDGIYTFFWDVPASWVCSPGTVTSEAVITCTAPSAGTFILDTLIFDGSGAGMEPGEIQYTVLSDPVVGTPTAYPSAIDVGQSVTFSTSLSGGASPYSYVWSGLPQGCSSADAASLSCTPTLPGTYQISVAVTDANGFVISSGYLTFVVSSPLGVATPVATPGSGGIDIGQQVVLVELASGGSGTYSYVWNGLPTGCSSSSSPVLACTPSGFTATTTFSISVTVSDSNGAVSTSSVLLYTVDSDPYVGAVVVSPGSIDAGQSITLGLTFYGGGSGGYTFDWQGVNGAWSCPRTTTSPTDTCTPTVAGTYAFSVTLTDSNGFTVASQFTTVYTVLPGVEIPGPGTVSSVAAVPIGVYPWGMYVDPNNGIAYAVETGDAPGVNFYEVSLSTDTVILTVTSSYLGPHGIWYDDATGLVWVAETYSNVVAAFNGATGALVATVNSCSFPQGMVDDPVDNSLWVTCYEYGEIQKISLTTLSVLTTVGTLNDFPYEVSLDPATGYLFVVDSASDNIVQVFNANTGVWLANVNVPSSGYTEDLAITSTGEVVVTSTSGTVSEFSESNFAQVTTLSGPAGAWGAAYDPELDLLAIGGQSAADVEFYCASTFSPLTLSGPTPSVNAPYQTGFDPSLNLLAVAVANNAGGTVAIFNVAGLAGLCPASVEQGAPSATPALLDAGQTTTLHVVATGGTGVYSYVWSGLPTGCSSLSTATLSCTPTGPGTFQVTVTVSDSNGDSVASSPVTVTVDPELSAASLAVSNNPADEGQSISFSVVSVTGGSGTYEYTWHGLPSGCTSSDAATIVCTPKVTGAYSVDVVVTDSLGEAVTSNVVALTLDPTLTVATPTASTWSGGIDVGESVTFTAGASGGSGSYSYAWTGLPTGCASANAPSVVCVPTGSTTFTIKLVVTDTNGNAVTSKGLSFAVLSLPTVTTPKASPTSVDLGQSTTFTVSASGGTKAYTFTWNGLPTGCASSNVTSLACTPTATGTYTITVTAVDTNGGSGTSAALTFTVYTDPTITAIDSSATSYSVGTRFTLTAVVFGGTGTGEKFAWTYASGLGCTASTADTLSCKPTAAGTYTISVTVTDSNGYTSAAASLTITVTDPAGRARQARPRPIPTAGPSREPEEGQRLEPAQDVSGSTCPRE